MRNDTQKLVDDFSEFLKDELNLPVLPEVEFVGNDFSEAERAFATFEDGRIRVQIQDRHPMDVLRSMAHEVIHWARNHTDGSDGSKDENEANAMAGKLMRKFGKEHHDGFSFLPEGLGNKGALASFFGTSPNYPDGFDVQNQGVVRRSPGEGPDSTEDAQTMIATDRNPEAEVSIDVVPNGVSKHDLKQIFRGLRGDPDMAHIYNDLVDSEAYSRLTVSPDQAEALSRALHDFLDTRKYDKPKKQFAQSIIDQLGMKMMESFSGDGEVEKSFERQDVSRKSPEMDEPHLEPSLDDYSPEQFNRPPQEDYTFTELPHGFVRLVTPGGNEQVFSSMEKAKKYADWHRNITKLGEQRLPPMEHVFVNEMTVDEFKKSSHEEHREHPWTTKKQAMQIALDHAKEGKTS